MTFVGLTWDHPRGYDALAAGAERVNAGRDEPLITWHKQPLEGFESHPIAELANAYDLLVLDHPHLGEAVAEDCVLPLEGFYAAEDLARWRDATIGNALASYCWGDKTWALPLDVAAQVMAYRPDRVAEVPDTWDDVLAFSKRLPVALSVGGPHALLLLFSFAAGLGALPHGDALLDDVAAIAALELMQVLAARAPTGTTDLNPIQLLKAMAGGNQIALVPLIFGYVTYATAHATAHRLAFSEAPRWSAGRRRGSVLGGTGIAFTRRCQPNREILDHVAWLLTADTQRTFIPEHHGQPSARIAWRDVGVNAAAGGFYEQTYATVDDALIRPRFDGYIAFQTRASALIRAAVANRAAPAATLAILRDDWHRTRAAARGNLNNQQRHAHA